MDHQDSYCQRAEQVVVVAVAATGLVADLEAIGQALEVVQHLLDAAHFERADDLSPLVEHANGDPGDVDVESDVKPGCLQVGYFEGAPPSSTLPDRQRATT